MKPRGGRGMIHIRGFGMNWCPRYRHEIDYEFVKVLKPNCIDENNGCGNCPLVEYAEKFEVFKGVEE